MSKTLTLSGRLSDTDFNLNSLDFLQFPVIVQEIGAASQVAIIQVLWQQITKFGHVDFGMTFQKATEKLYSE